MAEKLDIVIQKDGSSRSSGNDDGKQKSMAPKEEEITGISNQKHVPSSGGTSSHPSGSSADQWFNTMLMDWTETRKSNQFQGPKIPKVPRMLRQLNPTHYDPLVVSIGPYHKKNTKFSEMQRLKAIMASEFIGDSKKSMEDLYKSLVNVAKDAKKYYDEESIKDLMDDNEFTRMMFLDGCFILQFISCFLYRSDDLKMTRHDAALVVRDLFLLENQLPFQVLTSLLCLRFTQEIEGMKLIYNFIRKVRALPPQRDTIRKRVDKFLEKYIWRGTKSISEESIQVEGYSHATHLLELLRLQFIEEPEPETGDLEEVENEWYRYHPATELKRVGIHFEPSRTNLFWDVMNFNPTYFGGVLKLPPIIIDESTQSKLLNLVAFESIHVASNEQGVTSYVCFMDSLIDSAEDVRELRSKGIILSFLGSDKEVADLFNGIANNLVPNPKAYAKVKKDIESHYKNFFKLWMVRHKHDISIASAKYASLFGIIIAALRVVFPMQSTCIADLQHIATNFTRTP